MWLGFSWLSFVELFKLVFQTLPSTFVVYIWDVRFFFSLSRILLMIGDWRSSSNKRYLIEFHVNFFLYQNNFSSKTCDAMLTIRFEINCTRHFGLNNRGAWMNWKHAKSFPISVGGWVRGFSTQNRPSMMTWIIVLMVRLPVLARATVGLFRCRWFVYKKRVKNPIMPWNYQLVVWQ